MRPNSVQTSAGKRNAGSALAAAGALPVAGLVGYLAVLTAAAWRAVQAGDARTRLEARPRHRFAVLIPAHNEERLIAATLKSLAELDYPSDLVAVHVVADNCTDETVPIARRHGAEVHDRVAPEEGGKGPALQWLLQRLWDRGDPHDAVVIIDADTVVSPNFLRVMDAKLAQGATVVQSYYAVGDAGASTMAGFRAAALAARHYLRPLGRTRLGGSAGLYGNGMVFAADVLRSRSWTGHLTEDIEFQLELLLDGTRVTFAPDAVVEAEMPATVEGSQTQHERWERGRVEMAQRYVPRLVGRAVRGGPAGRAAYLDAAADQIVPPFSLLVAATGALGAVAVVWGVCRPGRAARRGVALTASLVAAQAAYVLSALRMVSAPASVYRSLLHAPRLVVWKVGLWLRVLLRRGGVSWVRTPRNVEREGAG
jgi:hypothetical protein